MNSTIRHAGLLAALAGAMALAACDSIKDVRDDESYAALPPQTAVLGGKIRNLGTRRPLILQYNGQDTCISPLDPNNPSGTQVVGECRFFGVLNEEFSNFSFGALVVGTPYNITVKKQPFAKICTVTNGSGVVGSGGPEPAVSCQDDLTIPRYTVTVNIAPAASSQPGLKVILTTEQKARAVEATGLSSFVFSYPDDDVFDNQFGIPATSPNLPVFGWRVTATIPGPTELDPVRNCFVTGGPVTNTGGNIGDDGVATAAPTGPLTVNVQSCGFTVRAQADYSRPAGVTVDPPIPSGQAVSLLLREQPSGIDVAGATITSFANTFVPFMALDSAGNPTTTPYSAPSHLNAFYEVVVRSSPTGMACVPGSSVTGGSASTSTRSVGNWTDAGAVLLRRPASARVADLWIVDRVVRCRAVPVPARQLRGVYQQSTNTTTVIGGGAPALVTVRNHNYLALFEDGSYMYGAHATSATNSGVEHGFYEYNPTATPQPTITFTGFTDTNGGAGIHTSATSGAPVPKTITNVAISGANPKVITANFTPPTNTTANGVTTTTTVDWRMTEVGPDTLFDPTPNPVDGAWVAWDTRRQAEDKRRVFLYQHGLYNAFHMGINGIANLQQACYVGNFGLTGDWTRQGGRSGCHMRVYTLRGGETLEQLLLQYPTNCGFPTGAPVVSTCALLSSGSSDIPNPTAALGDYPGRWPQSRNPDFTDGRPYSLVEYEVRLAGTQPSDPICPNADKLTVWDTRNGTRTTDLTPPIPPIVLCKVTAN
jgi:hypothetical protein